MTRKDDGGLAWSDEMCLRFAEAYEREQAAQMGEPAPWRCGDLDRDQRAEVIAAVRDGLKAVARKSLWE